MSSRKKFHRGRRPEALESRHLLSVAPQLVGDFNLDPPSGEYGAD